MPNHVLFAYAQEALPRDQRLPNRMALFNKLLARALTPVVSFEAEEAFSGLNVMTHQLVADQETTDYGKLSLENIGVLINRLDRSIKKDELSRPDLVPPMINENATRSLVWRKDELYAKVFEPLGLGIPTTWIARTGDIDRTLAEQASTNYVVKARNGSLGKGVEKVPATELHRFFKENPDLYERRVVQPAYDFTQPLPTTIRPYDEASREAFAGWNKPGKVKEVRMYGFHSIAGTDVFPAARVLEGGDNWFFVDPDTLPAEMFRDTQNVIEKTAHLSGAIALYGAVDYGYGGLPGQAADWHAIELNGLAPYMIGYDKYAHVADHLRELFANQIQATVMR